MNHKILYFLLPLAFSTCSASTSASSVREDIAVDTQDGDGNTALMLAAKAGHLDKVQLLIDSGASIDKQNKEGDTALICALEKRHAEIVQLLLNKKANVNIQGKHGYTPLMVAITYVWSIGVCGTDDEKKKIVQMIFALRPNLDLQDVSGKTALMVAVQYPVLLDTESLQMILDYDQDLGLRNKRGNTALMCCAEDSYSQNAVLFDAIFDKTIKQLVARGANEAALKQEVLNTAVRSMDKEKLRVCIARGAEINGQDAQGNTALAHAVQACRFSWGAEKPLDDIEYLFEVGARLDIPNNNGDTPLMSAVNQEDVLVLALCLSKASPTIVNMRNSKGETALMKAWRSNYSEKMIPLFLTHGADPVLTQDIKQQGLNKAAQALSKGRIRMCLDQGAAINGQDTEGNTALGHAVKVERNISNHGEKLKTIEYLFELGARVDIPNNEGDTPLMLCSQTEDGQPVLALCLSKASPAIVNMRNKKGETALMKAARVSPEERVRLLLEQGANPELKDEKGKTALDHSAAGGADQAVLGLLLEKTPHYDANKGLKKAISDWSKGAATFFMGRGVVPANRDLAEALIHAASCNKDMVEFFLNNGASVDSTNEEGETALMVAARSLCSHYNYYKRASGTEILTLLLERGANSSFCDAKGETALAHAVKHALHVDRSDERAFDELKKRIELLMSRTTQDDRKNAFSQAIKQGSHEIVDLIIGKCRYPIGSTDIMDSEFTKVVRALLEKDVYAGVLDTNGKMALFYAVKQGHEQMVTLLAGKMAPQDINLPDKEGKNLLVQAIGLHPEKICLLRALFERATAATVKASLIPAISLLGEDWVYFSKETFTSLMDLFVEKGVLIDQPDSKGVTALSAAVKANNTTMVEVLTKRSSQETVRAAYVEMTSLPSTSSDIRSCLKEGAGGDKFVEELRKQKEWETYERIGQAKIATVFIVAGVVYVAFDWLSQNRR